jgi:hypothetical protein
LSAFFAAKAAKNRAFRSNLFYRKAVKKDFRCNPWRRAAGEIAYAISGAAARCSA